MAHDVTATQPFVLGDDNFFGESFGVDGTWYDSVDDHGLHIAGTIMAKAHNNIGVRGIVPDAKSSNICLMVARVFGSVRSTSTSRVDEAMEWCVDNGAKVINLSLGTAYRSRNSERLIEAYAQNEDVLIVAAAGNAVDMNTLHSFFYPASFSGVLSVGSVDSNLVVSSFSQRNSQVDICAPGEEVLSLAVLPEVFLYDENDDLVESRRMSNSARPADPITAKVRDCDYGLEPCHDAQNRICIMKRGENAFSEKVRNCFEGGGVAMIVYNDERGNFDGSVGDDPPDIPALSVPGELADYLLEAPKLTITQAIGSYVTLSGTSMATPHVTGAIAKIWAARPSCTKDQVRSAILDTALDLGDSGRDDDYGTGLVQVAKAYEYLLALPPPCGERESNDTGDEASNVSAFEADTESSDPPSPVPTLSPPPTLRPATMANGPPVTSDSVWGRLKEKLNGSN
jgi:subtilisin family serine protease